MWPSHILGFIFAKRPLDYTLNLCHNNNAPHWLEHESLCELLPTTHTVAFPDHPLPNDTLSLPYTGSYFKFVEIHGQQKT